MKARVQRPSAKRVGIAPSMFLELSADGVESAPDQRSLTRRAGMVLLAAIFLFAVPLGWTMSADASEAPMAVLSKSVGASDDDRDDDDDDGDTRGDDGTASNQGTGVETQGNTDAGPNAQNTGASTRGETDGADGTGATEMTQGTGVETRGQTDPRADTGVSTRGETDPGDNTGATERR